MHEFVFNFILDWGWSLVLLEDENRESLHVYAFNGAN